jgi:glyoxylate/hydroxypyruvate reductase A
MALLIDIKMPDWLTDEQLRDELLQYYPEAEIRVSADPGNLDEIQMLTVSGYYDGEALKYPNLQVIQKTGAGVNNILGDESLPRSIQVVRLRTDS